MMNELTMPLMTDMTTNTHEDDHEDVDDICTTGVFYSIGHIRSELFMFLGKTMWRFSGRRTLPEALISSPCGSDVWLFK
jgi:hypothetical protein